MSQARFDARAASLLAACLPCAILAQPAAAPTLAHCASIGAAADRLVCYDKLAGRAPAELTPPAEQPAPGAATAVPAPSTSALAPVGAPPPDAGNEDHAISLLSKYWELDDSDKRGIFNFVGYQPNYVEPLHMTNRINRAPHSPTEPVYAAPDYRREEVKFQLSLRSKLVQELPGIGGDLWVAYTQQALWQVYNSADSKPFRNTDYQPEVMYVLATRPAWRQLPFGWQWRFSQLALAHQSNGQSDPLSRSWNRVYVGTGFENGDWSLTAKANKRIHESASSDNNPDLLDYRGRYEFQLNWAHGLQTTRLQVRSNLNNFRDGSAQLEWTYPVARDRPNGLRWFVQAFSGYGETLTDYNFRQTSVGVGVTFLQF